MQISKFIKANGTTALATACLAVTVSATLAAPPATIADTYGTVVIGDLPGMVDRGAELAKKVSPGISGEVLRGQLGMMLGDEGMKSVPAGSGLVFVMPQAGSPFLLLETEEGKAESFTELLNQRLGGKAKMVNSKLVAISMNEPGLASATGAMGTSAAELLNSNDDKFIVATFDADLLIKDKGAQIDAGLKNISAMAPRSDADSSSTAKMMQMLGQMVKSVGKRTDVATVKIDLSADGILFEKTMFPIGGVTMATPEGPSGQELLKSVTDPANPLLRFESFMDTQSAIAGLTGVNNEVLLALGSTQADLDVGTALMETASEAFGDGMAGSTSMDKDGTNGTYVILVINKDKALQYINDASEEFSTTGALTRMYKSMGLDTSMTLQRNVGNIDGEPVHQFSLAIKPPTGSDKFMAGLHKPKTGKLTFVNDKMVIALGKTSIDEAVAAVKAGSATGSAELESRAKLPANGALYLDYNVGAMATLLEADSPEAAEALQGLKGTAILEAFYTDAESLKLVLKIPSEMITQGVDAAKNMAQKRAAANQDADDADTTEDSAVTTAPASTE